MLNMIRADLYKMNKSLVLKILFGVTTISALTMVVISSFIAQGKLDTSMTGIGFLFADVSIMSILGAVLAGIFICGDFENKTIHDAVAGGASRGSVVVSKMIVFFCGLFCLLIPYLVITGIALCFGGEYNMGNTAIGFLNMLVQESGKTLQGSMILKLMMVMLTLLIVYMAQLSICVPLALLLKKPVPVIAINYIISILSGQLIGLQEKSRVFKNFYSLTPFGGEHAFVTLDTTAGELVKTVVVSCGFIIVILLITYGIFRKSEIK